MSRNTCKWIYDEDDDFWETECGGAFTLMAGTPKDNRMKFCPYCGKKIEQKEKEE